MSLRKNAGTWDRRETGMLVDRIGLRILTLRGRRVMIDADLAELYSVTTKRLNEQVRRNPARFPVDFVFRLSTPETEFLRSHFATSKKGSGGRRYRPFVFTEHGAIMAASVLNSPRAVSVSVLVVRAFIRLRHYLATHRKLAEQLAKLERRVGSHDDAIREVMAAIRELMVSVPDLPRERIGFRSGPKGI